PGFGPPRPKPEGTLEVHLRAVEARGDPPRRAPGQVAPGLGADPEGGAEVGMARQDPIEGGDADLRIGRGDRRLVFVRPPGAPAAARPGRARRGRGPGRRRGGGVAPPGPDRGRRCGPADRARRPPPRIRPPPRRASRRGWSPPRRPPPAPPPPRARRSGRGRS